MVDGALSDRVVTSPEVTELTREVKADGKVSAEERRELRQLLSQTDAFDPASRERMAALVEGRRPDLPDPALPGSAPGTARWRRAVGEPFVDGPSAKDPVQGKLGDCYLIATLSSLAQSDPQAVEELIRDNGDGTYDVRFFKMVGFQGRPVHVTVDSDLPYRGVLRQRSFAANSKAELWVSLVEKAFAQLRGSFGAIAKGGKPDEVMAVLTGRPHWRLPMYSFSTAEPLFEKLQSHLARRGLVVAATIQESDQRELRGTGLVDNHAYSVLGVSEEGGARYVLLRNPWGKGEPGRDGENDGVFKLPIEQFQQHFHSIYVGQVP